MEEFKQAFKVWLFNKRLNKAISKAEKYYKETRYHFLVIRIGNKPIVYSRKQLKEMIAEKVFNLKIKDFDRLALYKTY